MIFNIVLFAITVGAALVQIPYFPRRLNVIAFCVCVTSALIQAALMVTR